MSAERPFNPSTGAADDAATVTIASQAQTPTTGPRSGQKSGRIAGLDELMRVANASALPPVDKWDPPYCGDIGMAIAGDGTWFYQNSPIGRLRMVKLFSRILRRDADGSYFLVTPVEKVDVAVEDAPFIAVEMDVSGSGRDQVLTFRTNLDDFVVASDTHPVAFRQDPGSEALKPYVRVRGRLEARIARAVYYDLVELAVPHPDDTRGDDSTLGIWSSGQWFAIEEVGSNSAS